MFDIDAHLHGVASLPSFECDVLACALNERLDEIHRALSVPYRTKSPTLLHDDRSAVIDELLRSNSSPPYAADPGDVPQSRSASDPD